jgi:hypothetical protein
MFELFQKNSLTAPLPANLPAHTIARKLAEQLITDRMRMESAGYDRADIERLLDALPAAEREVIQSIARKLADVDRQASQVPPL